MKTLWIFLGLVLYSCMFIRTASSQEPSEVGPPMEMIVVRYPPAPSWIVNKSDEYMISLLGEEYFYNNITFVASFFKGPDHYAVEYRHPNISFIQIRLDSYGNVTYYRGPTKPYSFNLTKEEAINIAKMNGLQEPINAEILYRGEYSGGEYVWDVWSDSSVPGNTEIVFIDVDTGAVLELRTKPISFGVTTTVDSPIVAIIGNLNMQHALFVGQKTNITLKMESRNATNVTTNITLPEGIELVHGNLSWDGDLVRGEPTNITIVVKPVKLGNWTIEGFIESQGIKANFLSYVFIAEKTIVNTEVKEAQIEKPKSLIERLVDFIKSLFSSFISLLKTQSEIPEENITEKQYGEQNSDCVKVSSGCCSCNYTAINKKYEKSWNEKIEESCRDILCAPCPPPQEEIAICSENKCELSVNCTELYKNYKLAGKGKTYDEKFLIKDFNETSIVFDFIYDSVECGFANSTNETVNIGESFVYPGVEMIFIDTCEDKAILDFKYTPTFC